jgi:hydrogenase maturation protease
MPTRTAVIGYGSAERGNGRAGVRAVRSLVGRTPRAVDLFESQAEATALLDVWKNYDFVIVADAVTSGERPGAVQIWEAQELIEDRAPLFAGRSPAGLSEAIELAIRHRTLPPALIVVGIETEWQKLDSSLSAEVLRGISDAADLILKTVSAPLAA